MINRWTPRFSIITSDTWLLWALGFNAPPVYVCVWILKSASVIFTHALPIPSHPFARVSWYSLLKVKCYSRRKVTINMAKIVSLTFPRRPDTENNFSLFPGICRYWGKWRHTAPRSSGLLKVTSAVSTHLLMLPVERRRAPGDEKIKCHWGNIPLVNISINKYHCLIPFYVHG